MEIGPLPPSYPTPTSIGNRLQEDAAAFYVWYVSSCYANPSEGGEATRRALSQIMRIAEVCKNGSACLTFDQEGRAIQDLTHVREAFLSGSLKFRELQQALGEVLWRLIESNPRARIVSQVTELEYRLLVNPQENLTNETAEECKTLIQNILERVSLGLSDLHAGALSRSLSSALSNTSNIQHVLGILKECR
ncbi:MAG: hypothetical protein JSS61_01045 [Verrucomicrobia bacterium]|nr:hypothetical protein [Verrucomicrobiota bacterium]